MKKKELIIGIVLFILFSSCSSTKRVNPIYSVLESKNISNLDCDTLSNNIRDGISSENLVSLKCQIEGYKVEVLTNNNKLEYLYIRDRRFRSIENYKIGDSITNKKIKTIPGVYHYAQLEKSLVAVLDDKSRRITFFTWNSKYHN